MNINLTNSSDLKCICFDRTVIQEYQQNRDPYLLIDYVDKIIPGKIANGFL